MYRPSHTPASAIIATHHDDPVQGDGTNYNLIRVSWRMADTLGYAAFSPARQWSWEELIACLPSCGSGWLAGSPDDAKAEIAKRLAASPL